MLTLLGPQSRFGEKLLELRVVRPQRETAVLKGSRDGRMVASLAFLRVSTLYERRCCCIQGCELAGEARPIISAGLVEYGKSEPTSGHFPSCSFCRVS